MKPVYQTIEGEDGNCFAACVATILGRELADLPEGFRFYDEWHFWFRREGYAMVTRPVSERHPVPPGLVIVDAESPRGFSRGHAVVVQDGVIVHDPFKGGEPVTGKWIRWTQLRPTE